MSGTGDAAGGGLAGAGSDPEDASSRLPTSVRLLALCNALMYIGSTLLITVSALIGFELATDKRLATLPLALQFLSVMLAGVPASLFMGRFGRKRGFLLAGVIGVLGAALALFSILAEWFAGYCLATLCFGTFTAFGNHYRFTAAEVVRPALRGRAIAAVMAGGVLAAFIGPNLASWSAPVFSNGVFAGHPFAGPYAVLIGVYLLSMLTIAFAALPPPVPRTPGSSGGRPLRTIALQPRFVVAVLCQMLGYGTMNLVMTSTPLAMQVQGASLGDTAFVIQWHVVAMFAPSFVTGHLIARLGIASVLGIGVALGFGCVVVNLAGETMTHFTLALMLLGVSWNFLYVGGTTLLTDTYEPVEKARAQALNDLLVFSTVTLTALSAGGIHYLFGYRIVNLGVTPLLGMTALAVLWLALGRRRAALAAERAV